jgi:hypothetical protein
MCVKLYRLTAIVLTIFFVCGPVFAGNVNDQVCMDFNFENADLMNVLKSVASFVLICQNFRCR